MYMTIIFDFTLNKMEIFFQYLSRPVVRNLVGCTYVEAVSCQLSKIPGSRVRNDGRTHAVGIHILFRFKSYCYTSGT